MYTSALQQSARYHPSRPGAKSLRIGSRFRSKHLFGRTILSEKSATFRDQALISGTGLRGEILQLLLDALPVLAVGRPVPLDRDIGPGLGILGIDFQPRF